MTSAIVDFPAPDNPVSHSTAGTCSFNAARCSRPMVSRHDHMRGELVDEFGRVARIGENVAARDIDIALKGEGDRIALLRVLERALEGHYLLDPSGPTGTHYQHQLAVFYRDGDH